MRFGAWGLLTLASIGSAADITPRMLLLDGAVTASAVIAVGERGTIVRSLDQARTWQTSTVPATTTLTGVSFAPDAQHGWAVGHDALILTTTDGGLSWAKQYQGESLEDSFLDVLALDADRIIAVGAYGLYVSSKDGGRSWTRQEVLTEDRHLNRISRGPGGNLYIAGESGTLLRSSDSGASWKAIPAPYEGSFYGVMPVDQATLVAYGLRGHLFRSADDGATWENIPTPHPMLLATAVRRKNGFLIFAGQARTLLVSSNDGKSVSQSAEARPTAIAELIELDNGALLALGEEGANVLELGRIASATSAP
jgi:photosystem II stability/assembly factor-like uncharacterized protein